ncbi:COP9 signalosome complex subunit 2 [Saitozyma sp. JCM 24511]|nr:COP9 signalosome complex subunit 2 [Saitozyma sp. JCM 24511]
MSDDEFMMEDAADDEEYDFDYDDDDDAGMEDDAGDVENQYYKAKSLKEENAEGALKAFRTIVDEQSEKGEWGFKALKQMTKMNYLFLHRPDEALATYRELLGYTKSYVTRNYAEKSINNILDYVGGEGKHANISPKVPLDTLEKFYEATRVACEEAKNERLSTKSNLKLAKLWLDRKEYARLQPILKSLHATCAPGNGASSSEDQTKGSLLLELYAIEIQMYSDLKENRKLKEIYNAAMQVKNAIPHPRIMGVIRESGGKMWMMERSWDKASTDLFESFRQYDESGSPQRIQVLKYLVLTYMLMGSEINPFDSQETKPYKNDPQIIAMTSLVSAYQTRDVQEAERILKASRATIGADPFIQYFIDDLLRSLRTQYIVDTIKPYTRMELDHLAKTLNVTRAEAEGLVVSLILDGRIKGKIDQVQGLLVLERFHAEENRKYRAMDSMTAELARLSRAIIAEKVARDGRGGGGWGAGVPAFG